LYNIVFIFSIITGIKIFFPASKQSGVILEELLKKEKYFVLIKLKVFN